MIEQEYIIDGAHCDDMNERGSLTGIAVGTLGGFGLGLLLGSEFHGTWATLLGASMVAIFLASMILLFRKG